MTMAVTRQMDGRYVVRTASGHILHFVVAKRGDGQKLQTIGVHWHEGEPPSDVVVVKAAARQAVVRQARLDGALI